MDEAKTLLEVWQEKAMVLFEKFINLCKENNLRYYTCGGTTLGAVRHNNFIPWDDDIDVLMPRPDYEKLLSLFSDKDLEGVELVTPQNRSMYYLSYAKLCDKNTTLIETKDYPQIIGVYIDIFPLDSCSDDYNQYMKDQKKYELLRESLYIVSARYNLRSIVAMLYHFQVKKISKYIRTIFNRKRYRNKVLQELNSLFGKYSYASTKHVTSYASFWLGKEFHNIDWFGEGSVGKFGELDVINPHESDKYLTQLYGNYLCLPPVEKRATHHSFYFLDMNKRYSMQEINRLKTK